MAKPLANPADRVVRTRLRERVSFQTLTEKRAIRLSSVLEYTGRSHFMPWQRILAGIHDFESMGGIFTPLVYVEVETADVRIDPNTALVVRGESYLGRALDASDAVRNIVREGDHTVLDDHGAMLARSRMLNVFTRYDPDPARRRVTSLPEKLGLGTQPSRVIELPTIDTLVDHARKPDFAETQGHVWHYGQTDPNRHVNGTAYLRVMEEYIADVLHGLSHDLGRLYFARARIVYRKPAFRGEGYRRTAWFRSEAPLVLTGAFFKASDTPADPPSVAIELTMLQHADA